MDPGRAGDRRRERDSGRRARRLLGLVPARLAGHPRVAEGAGGRRRASRASGRRPAGCGYSPRAATTRWRTPSRSADAAAASARTRVDRGTGRSSGTCWCAGAGFTPTVESNRPLTQGDHHAPSSPLDCRRRPGTVRPARLRDPGGRHGVRERAGRAVSSAAATPLTASNFRYTLSETSSSLVGALDSALPNVTMGAVADDANRTPSCDSAPSVTNRTAYYCWNDGDQDTSAWYPQGITTSSDALGRGRTTASASTW